MCPPGIDKRLSTWGGGNGTYPPFCILQGICRTADADATGAGGLFRLAGKITWLVVMVWANHFGGLGCPLFREDGDVLFIFGAWKGTYAFGMFSRLLTLHLCRGHGDVVCLFDIKSD